MPVKKAVDCAGARNRNASPVLTNIAMLQMGNGRHTRPGPLATRWAVALQMFQCPQLAHARGHHP